MKRPIKITMLLIIALCSLTSWRIFTSQAASGHTGAGQQVGEPFRVPAIGLLTRLTCLRHYIKIVDIDVQKAIDLGLKWTWTPPYTVSEKATARGMGQVFSARNSISARSFTRLCSSMRRVSARGENATVRLLAMPNISLLDADFSSHAAALIAPADTSTMLAE